MTGHYGGYWVQSPASLVQAQNGRRTMIDYILFWVAKTIAEFMVGIGLLSAMIIIILCLEYHQRKKRKIHSK